jgi:DNA polymerase-3 subunit gamma/tau
MRDAQSMLDQLVSFCGDAINEANVLDVFGFTSREKVAALTQTLLARDNPAALSLIQKEAESGRELSQLLGELIGCLRALLVAKLDPSADGEGIPAHLWTALLQAADEYPPDRILAAIDVFAETEGRMKWATNKRLHFELGVIKAIQSLGEVRITDVIKVLTRGADFISSGAVSVPAPIAVEPVPTPVREQEPEPIAAPEPAPVAAAAPPRPAGGLSAFDSMIAEAPEVSEAPAPAEPPPWKNEKPAAEINAPEPIPAAAIIEDTFHNDPLIQAALIKFEGKVLA